MTVDIRIGDLVTFEVGGRIRSGIVVELEPEAEAGIRRCYGFWVQDSDGEEYEVFPHMVLQVETV